MQHEQALNFEVTLNAERSAKTKALDAYFVAHKQKEELQKQVNELSKQVESAKSAGSAPLTLEMCSSAREARDVLQLGPKAVEKDIVAKYEELVSLARAVFVVLTNRGPSAIPQQSAPS